MVSQAVGEDRVSSVFANFDRVSVGRSLLTLDEN